MFYQSSMLIFELIFHLIAIHHHLVYIVEVILLIYLTQVNNLHIFTIFNIYTYLLNLIFHCKLLVCSQYSKAFLMVFTSFLLIFKCTFCYIIDNLLYFHGKFVIFFIIHYFDESQNWMCIFFIFNICNLSLNIYSNCQIKSNFKS